MAILTHKTLRIRFNIWLILYNNSFFTLHGPLCCTRGTIRLNLAIFLLIMVNSSSHFTRDSFHCESLYRHTNEFPLVNHFTESDILCFKLFKSSVISLPMLTHLGEYPEVIKLYSVYRLYCSHDELCRDWNPEAFLSLNIVKLPSGHRLLDLTISQSLNVVG